MKDRTYTPEEIQQKFDTLPEEIRSFVYSADMLNTLQQIGTKHQLHIDQVGTLEGETADVMTGFSEPEEFATNLAQSLNIDQVKAEAVAKDVNDMLFIKIRESMKGGQGSAPTSATPQPAQPTPSSSPTATAPPMTTKPAITLPSAPAPAATTPKPAAPPPLRSAAVGAPHPSANPPKPQVPTAPHPHDLTLVEKTVTVPAAQPTTNDRQPTTDNGQPTTNDQQQTTKDRPTSYKVDPYREAVE